MDFIWATRSPTNEKLTPMGKDQLIFAMITNWDFSAINDEMINTVKTVFFPRMKYTRALDVKNIQAGENSTTVVSISPDHASADMTRYAVSSVLSEATTTFDSKIVSAKNRFRCC